MPPSTHTQASLITVSITPQVQKLPAQLRRNAGNFWRNRWHEWLSVCGTCSVGVVCLRAFSFLSPRIYILLVSFLGSLFTLFLDLNPFNLALFSWFYFSLSLDLVSSSFGFMAAVVRSIYLLFTRPTHYLLANTTQFVKIQCLIALPLTLVKLLSISCLIRLKQHR
jgi:hypothetical protein